MSLPYPVFWKGLANLLLVNFHDMELNHIIQILYYLGKINLSEL